MSQMTTHMVVPKKRRGLFYSTHLTSLHLKVILEAVLQGWGRGSNSDREHFLRGADLEAFHSALALD